MSSEADTSELRAVERVLIRLSVEEIANSEIECDVLLEIANVGSWILKFRHFLGVIYNNCETVFARNDCDATVTFQLQNTFWSIVNGGESLPGALQKGHVRESGSEKAIDLFYRKFIRSVEAGRAGGVAVYVPGNINVISSSNGGGHGLTVASSSDHHMSPSLPLKTGYLLKKRDLFSGWRCRYFKVFYGRLDYFISESDVTPRGSIELWDARVSLAGTTQINGAEHWTILVEPRNKDKPFRLASDLTGEAGYVDSHSWETAFALAGRQPSVDQSGPPPGLDAFAAFAKDSQEGGSAKTEKSKKLKTPSANAESSLFANSFSSTLGSLGAQTPQSLNENSSSNSSSNSSLQNTNNSTTTTVNNVLNSMKNSDASVNSSQVDNNSVVSKTSQKYLGFGTLEQQLIFIILFGPIFLTFFMNFFFTGEIPLSPSQIYFIFSKNFLTLLTSAFFCSLVALLLALTKLKNAINSNNNVSNNSNNVSNNSNLNSARVVAVSSKPLDSSLSNNSNNNNSNNNNLNNGARGSGRVVGFSVPNNNSSSQQNNNASSTTNASLSTLNNQNNNQINNQTNSKEADVPIRSRPIQKISNNNNNVNNISKDSKDNHQNSKDNHQNHQNQNNTHQNNNSSHQNNLSVLSVNSLPPAPVAASSPSATTTKQNGKFTTAIQTLFKIKPSNSSNSSNSTQNAQNNGGHNGNIPQQPPSPTRRGLFRPLKTSSPPTTSFSTSSATTSSLPAAPLPSPTQNIQIAPVANSNNSLNQNPSSNSNSGSFLSLEQDSREKNDAIRSSASRAVSSVSPLTTTSFPASFSASPTRRRSFSLSRTKDAQTSPAVDSKAKLRASSEELNNLSLQSPQTNQSQSQSTSQSTSQIQAVADINRDNGIFLQESKTSKGETEEVERLVTRNSLS